MDIPQDIEQFLLTAFDSVSELEGLLLLKREQESRWDAERLSQRLYIAPPAAEAVLQALTVRNLLSRTDESGIASYSYAPATQEIADKVDRLAEFHSKYLIPLTNLLHQKSNRAIFQFADAFRIKERKK